MDTSRLEKKINPMPGDVEKRLIKENSMDAYKSRSTYQLHINRMIIWDGY